MKKPIILYIIITIICVIALIMGIYYQFFKQDTQDVGTQGNILPDKNGEETELTQEDFVKKVYDFETNPNAWKFEGDKPAVIDFYATWCGPCKMMSPILDEISKEYEGKINVYKVNVDKEADLASVFGIRSIPSLLFVPMKKEPSMVQGAMPKNELKKLVDDILLESK